MDKAEILKIAELANLNLREDEIEHLRDNFTKIKSFIDQISEADVPDTEIAHDPHLLPKREDVSVKSEVTPEQFSEFMEGPYFKIPKVIE